MFGLHKNLHYLKLCIFVMFKDFCVFCFALQNKTKNQKNLYYNKQDVVNSYGILLFLVKILRVLHLRYVRFNRKHH